ncbi:hypothetical protein VHEMI06155 [[Torrubiella] hemipterigena]|uniref:Uncharacterized protein n=1 Tax=[Torrubiella] hemipterigena TaxID=1531966 RepID=A0A0A1SZU9_9HYPO|nr:hypothetical protein VHEMI06155 [[Torrubiella] hemipterigena]
MILPTSLWAAAGMFIQLAAAVDLQPMPQPTGCPLPEPWEFTDFKWYNGSHGVDCTSNHGNQGTMGCLCGGEGNWCEPPPAPCNGSVVNVCSTGLSSSNYKPPWGFGPWEYLTVTLPGDNVCYDKYMGYRTHEIGKGYLCTNLGPPHVSFVGRSDLESSQANFSYGIDNYASLKCDDGKKIAYRGHKIIDLDCDIDEFKNSTCTTDDFIVPITHWYYN